MQGCQTKDIGDNTIDGIRCCCGDAQHTLVSGGIIGGMKGNTQNFVNGHVVLTSIQQNIQAGVMQAVTLTNVGRLGLELGLDSSFTNLIGLSLSAIQGNIITNPTTTLQVAFNNIKPQLFSSLAQWGVTKLGTSLGLDPRISTLIGTPISAGIGTSFQQGGVTGAQIINAINEGVFRGTVTLGVEFATQKLDPLVGALTARAVTGAIAGGLSKDHDIFRGIFDAYTESTGNLLTLDGPGNDSWSQALYLSKVHDFSSLIQENGFANAFETYATSIFYRDSVEDIIKISGTVANYFQTVLTNPQSLPENMRPTVTAYNGLAALLVPTGDGDYLIISADGKQVFAQSKGGYYLEGTFGVDDHGEWVLVNGSSTQLDDNGIINLEIEDGSLRRAEFQSYDGNINYQIFGENDSLVQYNSNSDLKNAVIKNVLTDSEIVIRDGQYIRDRTSSIIDELLSQDQPWYNEFSVSKIADFTDQKLDQIADSFLGEAQDNMGWVLSATALNSAKDIFKGSFTDFLRFGESLQGAVDDFAGAWESANRGETLSAGYQAFLGFGKIGQEILRATVVVGAVKGLGVSAAKGLGRLGLKDEFLSLLKDERGFVRVGMPRNIRGSSLESFDNFKAATNSLWKSSDEAEHAWQIYKQANLTDDIMVIGRNEDTAIAQYWQNHQILKDPKWSIEVNDVWVKGGIDRRATFYIGSPQRSANLLDVKLNRPTVFARELEQLKKAGYKQVGDYMVPAN